MIILMDVYFDNKEDKLKPKPKQRTTFSPISMALDELVIHSLIRIIPLEKQIKKHNATPSESSHTT